MLLKFVNEKINFEECISYFKSAMSDFIPADGLELSSDGPYAYNEDNMCKQSPPEANWCNETVLNHNKTQGSFCVCAQPIRDDVTM